MKILSIKYLLILFVWFVGGTETSYGQDEVMKSAKEAIKKGDSAKLSDYFGDLVELNIEDEKESYSKAKAEFVLQDFFNKYKVESFDLIHDGKSKEGIKYAIGKYEYKGGSFRVYMLIKNVQGKYLIDTLDFGEE